MARKKRVEINPNEVERYAPYLNLEQLADCLGVSADTFQRRCKQDPELMRSYKAAKAKTIAVIAQSLVKKARDGDTSCQTFYLKTQAGWRERDREDKTTESVDTLAVSVSKLIDKLPG